MYVGAGTVTWPYIDACEDRRSPGTKYAYIGSYANEPSPDDGPPSADIVLTPSVPFLKKVRRYPDMDLTYSLLTRRPIKAGMEITTSYDHTRSVVAKGYMTWMDAQKAEEERRRKVSVNNKLLPYDRGLASKTAKAVWKEQKEAKKKRIRGLK